MDAKEAHKYVKWCNDNFIFIYPVPTAKYHNGQYKIAMMKRGKEKLGEQIFKDIPDEGEISVWNKIRCLYKEVFDKNHPNKTN